LREHGAGGWRRRSSCAIKGRAYAFPLSDTGSRAADFAALMTAVNLTLERWIRERPEQWFWVHRRWPPDPAASGPDDL